MVGKMITHGRLKNLAEALNAQQDTPGAQRSVDISEKVCERLMALKHGSGVSKQWFTGRDRNSPKHHDQFDKLVDYGFLDLARELLIIDQQ